MAGCLARRTSLSPAGRCPIGGARMRIEDPRPGGGRVRQIRLVFVTLAIFTLALSSPVFAGSSVVADATGDARAGSPAYLDLVQVKVTDQVGRDTLYFSAELAAAIPATPPDDFLAYNWFADVNGDSTLDYVVVVRWCTERTVPRCRPGTASTMGSVREPPRGRKHLLLVVQGRRRYSEGFRRSRAARRCVRVRVVRVEPLPSRGQRSGPGRLRSEHRLRVFRSLTLKPRRRASAGESDTVIRNTRSRRTQAGGTRGRRGSRAARDARGSRAGAPWRRARPVPRRRARGLSPPT